MPRKQLRCLELLLKYHEWGEAVRVIEQHADHSDLHAAMFALVINAALKVGQQYIVVWAVCF